MTDNVVVSPSAMWYGPLKVTLDVVFAAMLLVLLSPLILVLMILVKWTSPGPAIYAQVRLGRHGRRYTMFKLRSMQHDCERQTGPRWATEDDPRITPFGRFLRASHLDELPQLWNVLRGEMSLVGPRPERPEFVRELQQVIPGYRDRLVIRPGITGLAQVQLPADTDIAAVERKLACDLHYVRSMNLDLDARIILATATKIFGIPCDRSCKWFGVPTSPADGVTSESTS